jgi:hypothetical protein
MPRDRNDDERLVKQLTDALSGLTQAINRLTDHLITSESDVRMLEASLRRAQRASRRLKLLASAITRLDESTERR